MDPPMIIEPVRAIPLGRRRCWERSRTENPIFEQGDCVEGKLEGGLRRNPEPMQSAATTSDSNPISGQTPPRARSELVYDTILLVDTRPSLVLGNLLRPSFSPTRRPPFSIFGFLETKGV
jgi:hypothetical protein